ncbi:MAG TPA: hypothetical protein VMQ46_10140 [Acidimicrobiia bacterium]|nr:hypothetical protein [Acidimicrobiia bacterium]
MNTTEEAVRVAFETVQFETDLNDIVHRARVDQRRKTGFRLAFVAASLVIVTAVALLVRTPEASAYWAAVPSVADAALVDAAPELCETQLQADLPPLVLVDQRADAARVVFGQNTEGTSSMYSCTLIRSNGTWEAPPVEELPFPVHQVMGAVFNPDIAQVVIDQTDGIRVEAAMSEGFYHFWWLSPQSFPGGTMLLLDANGEVLGTGEVPAS